MQMKMMNSIPVVVENCPVSQAQDLSTNCGLEGVQARMDVQACESKASPVKFGPENQEGLTDSPVVSGPRESSPKHETDNVLYSLKWNEFYKQLSAGLSHLFYTQDFADVTLCCEGKSAQAHKVVLAMCSPYFRQIFKENPCKHPVVIIKGIKFHDLQRVLKFIYFGEVSVMEKEIQDFIDAAELLKLDGLSTGDVSDTHSNSKSNPDVKSKFEQHCRTVTCHGPPGPNLISRRGSEMLDDGRKSEGNSNESHYETRISPTNFLETQLCHSQGLSPTGSVISHSKRKYNGAWRCSSAASVGPPDRSSPLEIDHNTSSSSNSARNSKISPVIVENTIGPGSSVGKPFLGERGVPATISRSSSGSADAGAIEHTLPVMISMEESREPPHRMEDRSGEYELSIRNMESTLGPMKSFTTPSGMVVTSTLRGYSGSCSTSNSPSPWSIGQHMKSPIPSVSIPPGVHLNPHSQLPLSVNSVIKGAPPHLRAGLPPSVSYSKTPLLGKVAQSSDVGLGHSPSSVPAKKRFSHYSQGVPIFPGVEVCSDRGFMDLDQRSMLKTGGMLPMHPSSSAGSPNALQGLSGSASLSLVPRLKNQRHSQVPQSARYTTAEVDAMVDSVTNHSGPFVPCKICDKLVKRERLRAHIHECHLVHGEKIICPHCGVGLKSKGSYRVHVWRHRRGVLTKGLKSKRIIVQRTPRPPSPE